MDINFNNITFKRLIMHTINAKSTDLPKSRATVDPQKQLFNIDGNVESTLKKRLIDAVGRKGKAFKLTIKNFEKGSFYDICSTFKNCTEKEFITSSVEIANLLASSQDRSSYPGGYLLIVQGLDEVTKKDVYIVIKAEPHEALITQIKDGKTLLTMLDKIFLSPTQKLYKIGVLVERSIEEKKPNQKFDSWLFDDQFNSTGLPAAYFYESFLGFSLDNNSEIQSMLYYTLTEDFIRSTPNLDPEQKHNTLNALRAQVTVDQTPSIMPLVFSETYFDEEIQRQYRTQVASKLPTNFLKNTVLINTRLKTKKINFPHKIKITGPDEQFDQNVHIVRDKELLNNMLANNPNFTIVLIGGKPFSGNE